MTSKSPFGNSPFGYLGWDLARKRKKGNKSSTTFIQKVVLDKEPEKADGNKDVMV